MRPRVCRVHSGSLGSFVFAHSVVHSGAPWWSFCSFGVVEFIQVLFAGRWVLQDHWVDSGAPCGSFGFVVFIRARPGGGWVHSGSIGFNRVRPGCQWVHSGSFVCALGVIQVRSVNSGVLGGSLGTFGCAVGVVGFVQVRLVHSCAPWGLLSSFGCALGFIRVRLVRPGGHSVHSGASSAAPCGSLASFVFIRCIRVRSGGHSGVSLGLFWFNRVRPGGRCVHSGSLGSLVCALVVIRRWVRSGAFRES